MLNKILREHTHYLRIINFQFITLIFLILSFVYFDAQTKFDKIMNIENSKNIYDYQNILDYEIYNESNLPSYGLGFDNKIIYLNLDIGFKLNEQYFIMKKTTMTNTVLFCMLLGFIIYHVYTRYTIISITRSKSGNDIIKLQGSEAILSSKNLSLLAENIHHELKTPLIVILNKLDNIRTSISSCDETDTIALTKDIDLIETHIDVIYNLLNRMKNFKNIKRTTENKSLYEIITVAFQTLELFSKTKFKYTIDQGLRNFIVTDKLTNEDVLNVFINHIKNSLEAYSTRLEVIKHEYKENMLYLQLVDNGNGIPKKAQSNIFVPNFSTKGVDVDMEERGIGLYLSKTTLTASGGDDFLIESSSDGTSFGINIPALRR